MENKDDNLYGVQPGQLPEPLQQTPPPPINDSEHIQVNLDNLKKPKSSKIVIVIFAVLITLALPTFAVISMITSRPDDGTTQQTINGQGQTITDQPFDAKTSPDVPTVREVRKELSARGFELMGFVDYNFANARLEVSSDINGAYLSDKTIEEDSDDKYPSYMVFYVPHDSENIWLIYINNGNYFARPFFEIDGTAPNNAEDLLVSETDYATQYDSRSNMFRNAIPDPNEALMIKVEKVDKATLDSLTAEKIRQLW